jgi:uncharacterized protein
LNALQFFFALTAPVAPLSLWDKTSGTWINIITILGGTGLGLCLQGNLPRSMQLVITQGLGLLTLFLGITMGNNLLKVQAGHVDGIIIGLLAIVLGGMLGEWWQIESRLNRWGDWLKQRVRGDAQFTTGFVAASLLFCVGPMAILGSLNNGLTGSNTILTIKAGMDGLAAIALTSRYGLGIGFSSLPILVYQGGLSLMAGWLASALPDPTTAPPILAMSGVGGLIIMGIGLTLLEIAQIKIAAFLPALFLAPGLYLLVQQWH